MESNETGVSPFYSPHQPSSAPTPSAAALSSVTNGLILDHVNGSPEAANQAALYPHSVAWKAPSPATVEPARRKRGRPRKYSTPEEAAAAKRAAAAMNPPLSKKKEQPSFGGPASSSSASSSKKLQHPSLGVAGQSFSPHVINVVDGEDVAQKIMSFVQQAKRELCILSASGYVKFASLREQPTSGGNVTIKGHFHIVSLSGSYVQTNLGTRAGGLSACLSSPDGQIIGGGIGGPLVASGPVQVIVGTFLLDTKKEPAAGSKTDVSTGTLPSPVSMSTGGYLPAIENSGRYQVTEADDHQDMVRSPYMVSQGMHVQPDWRGVSYNFAGQAGHGAH